MYASPNSQSSDKPVCSQSHSGNSLFLKSVLSVECGLGTEPSTIECRKKGYISRVTSLSNETVSRTYISNIRKYLIKHSRVQEV